MKPVLTPNDYKEELRLDVRNYLAQIRDPAKNLTTCRFGSNLANFDRVGTTNVKNIHWMLMRLVGSSQKYKIVSLNLGQVDFSQVLVSFSGKVLRSIEFPFCSNSL